MFNNLLNLISNKIYTNIAGAVTGDILKEVINSVVTTVGINSNFMGIATSSTVPEQIANIDGKQWYLAVAPGTYHARFGSLVLTSGDIVIFYTDSTWKSLNLISNFKQIYTDNKTATDKQINFLSDNKEEIVIPHIYGDYKGYADLFSALTFKETKQIIAPFIKPLIKLSYLDKNNLSLETYILDYSKKDSYLEDKWYVDATLWKRVNSIPLNDTGFFS